MTESDSKIIQTGSGKKVRLSYRRACRGYTVGFSIGSLLAACVMGYLIMWEQHIPESVYSYSVFFYVTFTVLGVGVLALSYAKPVWFYETLEGSPDE